MSRENDLFSFGITNIYDRHLNLVTNTELLERMLLEGKVIHTCYDYPGQLKLLKETSIRLNTPLKLIVKVYLDYPIIDHIRRMPLIDQVKRIFNFMWPAKSEIILQLSSIPKDPRINIHQISDFLESCTKIYKIKKILLETFPDAEKSILKVYSGLKDAASRRGLSKEVHFGFTSYDSPFLQGFSKKMVDLISQESLYYMPMQVFTGMPNFSKENIALAQEKIIQESSYKFFYRAVTATTNPKHYEENIALTRSRVDDSKKSNVFKKFTYHPNAKKSINPYGIVYTHQNLYEYTKSLYRKIRSIGALFRKIPFHTNPKLSLIKAFRALKAGFF